MKNSKTIISISLIIVLIIGGLLVMKKNNEKALIQIQKNRIEEYLRYNYNGVEIVTFMEYKKVPSGSTYIAGYINNNEKLDFAGWLTPFIFEGQFSSSSELEKMAKPDDLQKNPKEIEAEKNSLNNNSTSNSYLESP